MWTDPRIRFAIDVVREASLLVQRIQAEMVTPALAKQDRSPVTVADFAAQALLAFRLQEAFPGDVLVGEESSGDLQTDAGAPTLARVTQFVSQHIAEADEAKVCQWIDRGAAEPTGRFWTLDPVDGTKGFLRRDQYAVAFAHIENGQVQLAVLGCPALSSTAQATADAEGLIVAARLGAGTWGSTLAAGEWDRWNVSQQADPAQARLLRSVESGHTNTSQIDALSGRLGMTAPPVGMDSQAKYAALAAGHAELLVRMLSPDRPDYREKIWDQAAGSLVVEEAGGRVSDLDGQPLDFGQGRTLAKNRGVVATNGLLHDAVLAALREIDG